MKQYNSIIKKIVPIAIAASLAFASPARAEGIDDLVKQNGGIDETHTTLCDSTMIEYTYTTSHPSTETKDTSDKNDRTERVLTALIYGGFGTFMGYRLCRTFQAIDNKEASKRYYKK